MKNFLRTLIKKINASLPVLMFIIFISCVICVYNNTDVITLTIVIAYEILFTVIISGAIALREESEKRNNNLDSKIIKDCFSSASKASRLFYHGVEEININMYNEALEDLKNVENMDLTDRERAVLCFYIGKCYNTMGYPTNAAAYYEKSIENNIDLDFVYILAARCYVSNGSYSGAMELYEKLIERKTYFDYIYTDMGMCQLKKQDADKALEYFQLSIDKKMNYPFALGGCSLAYLMKKDIEKSKEFFSKALINNINDIDGFRSYYCSVAEAEGCLDLIDEHMKEEARKADEKAEASDINMY